MFRKLGISLVVHICLVSLALGLAGCAGSSLVSVTQDQNGGSVELQPGGILEVRLQSNITTGYSWQLVSLDGQVLAQQGEVEYQPDSALPKAGAGGVEVFRFKALAPGEMVLKLHYQRPWEQDVPPLQTFELLVMVK